ncbi:hypothetical protein BCR44DRAFT_43940 [Catenaria anguillulae PL171]|uniref:Uncharacterized protein n=1 Tax=Catenaria anguillulae PL171 TaxID=765915 RepID=A0A1Y2HTJ8_9FUNG|nr:hypothetical protein BCR44DRAFT_43940 [Catenaria anguillulae PL171]
MSSTHYPSASESSESDKGSSSGGGGGPGGSKEPTRSPGVSHVATSFQDQQALLQHLLREQQQQLQLQQAQQQALNQPGRPLADTQSLTGLLAARLASLTGPSGHQDLPCRDLLFRRRQRRQGLWHRIAQAQRSGRVAAQVWVDGPRFAGCVPARGQGRWARWYIYGAHDKVGNHLVG